MRPLLRVAHLRVPGLLLAALLLPGCGADRPEPVPDATPPTTPPAATSSPGLPKPPGDSPSRPGAATVPHRDEGVARTGEVATRRATCVRDGTPGFSFDGTVTRIDDGQVTFEVTESFTDADLPAAYTVAMGAPVTGGATESSPSYSVGTRLLVSGADGVAWGCGATVYYDEAVASERRS